MQKKTFGVTSRLGILWIAMVWTLLSGIGTGSKAQQTGLWVEKFETTPATLLEWFLGKQQIKDIPEDKIESLPKITGLLLLGRHDEAEQAAWLMDSVAGQPSVLVTTLLTRAEYAKAWRQFTRSAGPDSTVRGRVEAYAARYVSMYGQDAPIFPGYNGGFYHFLKDSLAGGQKLSTEQYDETILALVNWYQLTQGKSAVALELLGDVLFRHPDRFIGKYFGALTYMTAAELLQGNNREVMLRKSIFAIEAPNEVSQRFDRYRFTQLHKAYLADRALPKLPAGENTPTVTLGGVRYMDAKVGGALAGMLTRAREKIASEPADDGKPVGQVDVRKVKQDTTFNLYAILLISFVIGSIVFFWIKIKRATKQG